jgi:hypothetical protein
MILCHGGLLITDQIVNITDSIKLRSMVKAREMKQLINTSPTKQICQI